MQSQPLSRSVSDAAAVLLAQHQLEIWQRTDVWLSALLGCQWALGIVLALWRSPLTWNGNVSRIHPHVWAAIFLGGAIMLGPVVFARLRPGSAASRQIIAIGLMLMSGLLIHLGGGQIEMHFQLFGVLAFLTFYRDWRVLITATVVTASDHLLRGIFIPQSIYGVTYASLWLTAEHAAWVLFEDGFLIGSCVMGVREMRRIAENRALLEHSYHDVEKKVAERTAELKSAQEDLLHIARTAGMAEIATSVLHNVGNVLNSVNVSATIVVDRLRDSEVASLGKVSQMMDAHKPELAAFLTTDERGKLIPDFITELAQCLGEEQQTMLGELENLRKGIEHIKQVVAAQQSMAKSSFVGTAVVPATLFETALGLQAPGLTKAVRIRKHFEEVPATVLDQHKVLQVLINLIGNARHAVAARTADEGEISLSLGVVKMADGDRLRYRVTDNGVGIAPAHLTRIFSLGFTTKREGHGFGLHSAANAAREMGGSLCASSEGKDKGAVFTLDLPLMSVSEETACNL